MTYTLHYRVDSISYDETTRVTCVSIINLDTGESYEGQATRNPNDEMNIALATNLATARAVRQAIEDDLKDMEQYIDAFGSAPQFDY